MLLSWSFVRRVTAAFRIVTLGSARQGRQAKPKFILAALGLVALGFAGCAQSPEQVRVSSHGREYFPEAVYGRASPRVVADGQPIPRGGGQYLVGKPYTIAGRTYYPSENHKVQVGLASWYGDAFHGRLTANGEIYDRDSFTAASPVLPLPSYVRVTNLRNNYSMIVRVNDRGPYASDRIMDVSRKVAEALDFKRTGTTMIKVDYVGRAGLGGSDDAKLYATLRTNETPAGRSAPIFVADSTPRPTRVAALSPYVPAEPPLRAAAPPPEPLRRPFVAAPERRRTPGFAEEAPVALVHERAWSEDETATLHPASPALRPVGMARPVGRSRPETKIARFQPVPPSRPMDLGTIPGAGSRIHARTRDVNLRLARERDD